MPTLLAIGTGKGTSAREDCRRLGGLDAPVPDGAEVQVLPSVAGG